jgi:homoprotocatechuate degradation regulator HpaR
MSKSKIVSTRRSLPIALLRSREAVMRLFRPHLAKIGLTEQQWRVLRVLAEDGPSEAGHVADRACILPPSLSRIIKALEGQRLIASSRDVVDARRIMIQLSPQGMQLLESAAPQSAAIYAAIEKAFGRVELLDLLDKLDQLQNTVARIQSRDDGNQ